ncbi:MAG: hypothetical protein PHI85_02160 [Victivallaceae bacterium]|nr:hypothetical protein [Victivallaceae bacterium]
MTGLEKFFCAAAICCGICGCGDPDDSDQAPPIEGLQLVDRMFGNMDKHDFPVAAAQYRKLISTRDHIDPIALLMEQIITTNSVVLETQKRLDSGDFDGALLYAKDAKRLNPLNQEIDAMLGDLQYAAALRSAVAGVRSAQTATALSANLAALNGLLAADKRSAPLKALAADGQVRLGKMIEREDAMGMFDLLADIYYSGMSGGRDLSVMRAQYELELKKRNGTAPVAEPVRNALYKRP